MVALGLVGLDDSIDKYFDQIDKDRSGTLNLDEFRPALQQFREKALAGAEKISNIQAGQQALRAKSEELQLLNTRMRRTIDAYCAKQVKLDAMKASQPLEILLGDYLNHSKISVEEWVKSWDKDGDGNISKVEFKQRVCALKVSPMGEATEEGNQFLIADRDGDGRVSIEETQLIEGLFKSLDKSGDGRMDTGEAAIAMRGLKANAKLVLQEWEGAEAEIKVGAEWAPSVPRRSTAAHAHSASPSPRLARLGATLAAAATHRAWHDEAGHHDGACTCKRPSCLPHAPPPPALTPPPALHRRWCRAKHARARRSTPSSAPTGRRRSKVNVVALLRQWDKSGDGKVDKKEFKSGLGIGVGGGKTVVIGAFDEEIDLFFEEHDLDGDGTIQIEELK
eukprot:4826467-Prymnesium_polylepis.1